MSGKKKFRRLRFAIGEFVVYPAHGVGQIVSIDKREVAGSHLELFVIDFAHDKMKVSFPVAKIASVGMRKLADASLIERAIVTLKGRARIKRMLWALAQHYQAKINSGDIVSIAEVIRDLHRSVSEPAQSPTERQFYDAALRRLSREIAVVQNSTLTEAFKVIEEALVKEPRRRSRIADDPVNQEAA